ncbi:MAG: hypothetical protein K0S97_1711, partial [Chloroflexota bacterium]|nr:hypothetical protein [Chloroflexota bacterium]
MSSSDRPRKTPSRTGAASPDAASPDAASPDGAPRPSAALRR